MKKPSDPGRDPGHLRDKIIGLGERSTRKSYYPQLREQIEELERSKKELEERSAALLNILEDLEESRRVAEDNLEKFHTMADYTSDWEYWIGSDNHLVYISPSCEKITGHSQEEFYQNPHLLEDLVHPDDRALVQSHFQLMEGRSEFSVVEFRILHRDGTVRWIRHSCRGIVSRDGKNLGRRVSNKDITERKQGEMALDQARRKLNLLNSITFTDIQNALFSLSGYNDLERRIPMDEKLRDYKEKERRLIQAIADSLKYATMFQSLGLKPPVWQDVLQSFLMGISHLDISGLHRQLEMKGVEIFADPLLENVFFALADNIIQHGRTATAFSFRYQESADGLHLVFEDNGTGVPIDLKEKIFEREFGRRKNIGLYLSREILSITGISITENGEAGKGARFEIIVPKEGYRIIKGSPSR